MFRRAQKVLGSKSGFVCPRDPPPPSQGNLGRKRQIQAGVVIGRTRSSLGDLVRRLALVTRTRDIWGKAYCS